VYTINTSQKLLNTFGLNMVWLTHKLTAFYKEFCALT